MGGGATRARLLVIGAVALGLLAAACDRGPCPHDGNLPASWQLQGGAMIVEVTRDPYTVTVRDAAGAVVLQSLGAGAGDGYAALGFTGGSVAWQNVVSPGYYQMTPQLNPWKDRHRVVSVQTGGGGDTLAVALEGPNARQCVRVTHTLRAPGTLRVDATVDGPVPRAWSAAFSTPADEAFLGFGERYNRTDQRGLSLYSWPEEGGLAEGEGVPPSASNPFPNGETMTYYPVPFFVSTRGYGFWLDAAIDTLDDGDHPGVVGPADVAEVYDVVGLVSTATGAASFTLWDGGTLAATWSGGFAAAGLVAAAGEAELATCSGCYLRDDLGGGLARVRLSSADATVAAGGLTLAAATGRRVRWDLYLVE